MLDIKKQLKEGPIFLDGATGTNLFEAGMPVGVCPEQWICENPQVIKELQSAYVEAGSQIIYAPTFSGNRIKLKEYHLEAQMKEINTQLVQFSKTVAQGKNSQGTECYVAADLTMTGQALKPTGPLDFEDLVNCYKEQIQIVVEAGVDLIVIETMMSLAETRAAVIAAKETCDLPVFVTMSFEVNGRTLYGTDPVTALVTLQAMGVDAFGINCSCGPDMMVPWVKEMAKYATIPLIVKPNAGMPALENGKTVFNMSSEDFSAAVIELIKAGASIVGGCCGTTPTYIHDLKQQVNKTFLDNGQWASLYENIYANPDTAYERVLTSERKAVAFDLNSPFMVVGERINPTGKKALQVALKNNQLDLVCQMAEDQIDMGAKILDINVGMPDIDEMSMMEQVIQRVGESVDAPLCIDSSNPEVIIHALRRYPGRALVNSVSCEEDKIKMILPAVKKYGAMFILLPMTATGLPKNFDERLANIQMVLREANKLHIPKSAVVVDGLVGAVGAVPTAAVDTWQTIEWCKNNDITTICGLSNISFGLPDRSYVNSTFLAVAISKGLTMAIANPSQSLLMRTALGADLLMAKQGSDLNYIEACNFYGKETQVASPAKPKEMPVEDNLHLPETLDILKNDVLKGKTDSIGDHVKVALEENYKPQDILNQALIPAINLVGDLFSKQIYFLPQLMLAADAMSKAIEVLEPVMLKLQGEPKGPVTIIATVKGDVHDIGKNLVAMMMKNYGFKVIDLGKDVDKETIIEAAKQHKAAIIGLSALMTTTMQYMKEVIDYAKEQGIEAKVIIGGAATTEEYANSIGAAGYSANAVDAVMLVKRLLDLD